MDWLGDGGRGGCCCLGEYGINGEAIPSSSNSVTWLRIVVGSRFLRARFVGEVIVSAIGGTGGDCEVLRLVIDLADAGLTFCELELAIGAVTGAPAGTG
jgi:hypothetical protein